MMFYVDIAVFKILFQGNCIVFSTGNSLNSCQLSSSFLTLGRLNYHMLKNVEQRVCLRFRSININNFIMNIITAMGSYCFFCHCKDMALNKTNNSD